MTKTISPKPLLDMAKRGVRMDAHNAAAMLECSRVHARKMLRELGDTGRLVMTTEGGTRSYAGVWVHPDYAYQCPRCKRSVAIQMKQETAQPVPILTASGPVVAKIYRCQCGLCEAVGEAETSAGGLRVFHP